MKKYFYFLFMQRIRTLLSALGVLFGVAAIISMLSIGEGAKQETLEQIEQLGMNNIIIREPLISDQQRKQIALEKKSQGINGQDVKALHQNIPFLKRIASLKQIEVKITGALTELSPEILATTRSFGQMKELELAEGRFLCDLDQQQRLVCVLGYEVAKRLGKEGHVGRALKLDQSYYEIVGVLKSTHWKSMKNQAIMARNLDKAIFIPLDAESGFSKNRLSEIILQIQNPRQMKMTVELVQHLLKKLHGGYEDYQILVPQELLRQAYRTQNTFNWVLGSIAAISLLVGGIGIMNIMLATVSERTREIGIRRALGANKRHILIQFLLEALSLTSLGAILGVTLGICFSLVINYIVGWKTIVTFWSIFLSLMMSFTVGICSGLYPAYQAANMDPIQALRHH